MQGQHAPSKYIILVQCRETVTCCIAVKNAGKNAVWNESFQLDNKASAGDEVEVKAFDKDMGEGE